MPGCLYKSEYTPNISDVKKYRYLHNIKSNDIKIDVFDSIVCFFFFFFNL